MFWREATENAVRANNGDQERWYFALLHLALATEHTLKAHLSGFHPALIRERIEDPKKTVSIIGAIQRLHDADIGDVLFSEKEDRALRKAADLRNSIAHGQRFENAESVRAQFTYIMAFLRAYQFRHLSVAFQDVFAPDKIAEIMKISEQVKEFEHRAMESLKESQGKFETEEVFICRSCGNEYLTIEDEVAICHFCQQTDTVAHCPKCDQFIPEGALVDFSDQFDYWQEEGRSYLRNDFGYDYTQCCTDCVTEVEKDIREAAYQLEYAQYMEDVMMDARR
jgi:rubrerythrin